MRARQTLFKDLATPADLKGVIKEDEWNTNLPRYFLQKYRAADFSKNSEPEAAVFPKNSFVVHRLYKEVARVCL